MRPSLLRQGKRFGQVWLVKDGNEWQANLINKVCKRSETALGITPEKELNVSTFRQNKRFVKFLVDTIKPVAHLDKATQDSALQAGNGYVHLVDMRAPLTQARSPEPEDIILSLQAKDGKLQEGTAEGAGAYRVLTTKGVMKLSDELHKHVVKEIERLESQAA